MRVGRRRDLRGGAESERRLPGGLSGLSRVYSRARPDPRTVWLVVLALSLTSPLLIVAGLPFLRDGILVFGRDACGTRDNEDDDDQAFALEEP